jgi:poly(A) polymerase
MNLSKEINRYKFISAARELSDDLGFLVFLVGGFVRDLILNRVRNDLDFLIVGNVKLYSQKLADELGVKNVIIYKNFGTAHFIYDNINFEFVAARKESYKRNSRKPDVEQGTFNEDISRRDFTINTLAIVINGNNFGEVIDTYNGIDDIKAKLIRTPIDPLITFDDDPLRILRAYRFASELNFSVDEKIDKAAWQLKDRLEIVSQERITDEFMKIIASPKPSVGLRMLYNSGVMEVIFPEVAALAGVDQRNDYHHKDVFLHTCEVVDNISQKTNDLFLRLTALLHDIAKPQTKKFIEGTGWTFHGHEELGARKVKQIFKKLKLPFNKINYVEKLIRLHLRPISLAKEEVTDSAIRRLIVTAGDDLEDLITLCRADITSKNPDKVNKYLQNYENVMNKVREVKEKDKLRAFQSPVRGETIMEVCNLKPSKKVGDIKKAIEDAILDGIIENTYEDAYEYLLKIKDNYLND